MSNRSDGPLDPETILSRVALFARLDRRDLRKLAKLCVPRSYGAGELVVQEGETGLGLFLLTAGRVKVFVGDPGEPVDLGFLGPGDVLGEMALLDDQPRSASAVAVEATDCFLVTRDDFSGLVEEEPAIAWCIVPALSERIRVLDQKAAERVARSRREETSAETGAAEAEAASASTEATDDEKEDEEDTATEMEEALVRFFRAQYALMMGGLKGFEGMLRAWEKSMAKLADESRLRDSDRVGDVLEKLPRGLLEAMRTALEESEEVPDQMAKSFRRHLKKETQG